MSLTIWQFVGYHNSGKTTYITNLIPKLKGKGYRTAVIKHHGHDQGEQPFIDTKKDTGKHWVSGAETVTFVEGHGLTVLSRELPELSQLVDYHQVMNDADILLIEGFKQAKYHKVLFHRGPEDDQLIESLTNIRMIVTQDDPERLGKKINLPIYTRENLVQSIEDLMDFMKKG